MQHHDFTLPGNDYTVHLPFALRSQTIELSAASLGNGAQKPLKAGARMPAPRLHHAGLPLDFNAFGR